MSFLLRRLGDSWETRVVQEEESTFEMATPEGLRGRLTTYLDGYHYGNDVSIHAATLLEVDTPLKFVRRNPLNV